MLALVEWARGWNAAHPEQTVRFIGYDIQDNRAPADSLRAFLTRIEPGLLPRVEDALRTGRYALRDFLPGISVDYVAEDELRHIRGTARSMLNVNTPEELAAVGGSLDDP